MFPSAERQTGRRAGRTAQHPYIHAASSFARGEATSMVSSHHGVARASLGEELVGEQDVIRLFSQVIKPCSLFQAKCFPFECAH